MLVYRGRFTVASEKKSLESLCVFPVTQTSLPKVSENVSKRGREKVRKHERKRESGREREIHGYHTLQ